MFSGISTLLFRPGINFKKQDNQGIKVIKTRPDIKSKKKGKQGIKMMKTEPDHIDNDGLTTLRLQKLSATVRDYMYLILTNQTSTRGPIVDHEA